MPTSQFLDASSEWLSLLYALDKHGAVVAPRGLPCKEMLGHTTRVSIATPMMAVVERKIGYKFMAAEAAWILSGDNRLKTIKPYAGAVSRYSDDGLRFYGAYGPMVVEQLSYITKTLSNDHQSRQAVMSIWRPRPGESKDVPCTVAIQWLIREGQLHCIDTMRSSDAWLGWPYDIFNFSMLTHYLRIVLRERYKLDLRPGVLRLVAGSQHLYKEHWGEAEAILAKHTTDPPINVGPVIDQMKDPDELIDLLWAMAQASGAYVGFEQLTQTVVTEEWYR